VTRYPGLGMVFAEVWSLRKPRSYPRTFFAGRHFRKARCFSAAWGRRRRIPRSTRGRALSVDTTLQPLPSKPRLASSVEHFLQRLPRAPRALGLVGRVMAEALGLAPGTPAPSRGGRAASVRVFERGRSIVALVAAGRPPPRGGRLCDRRLARSSLPVTRPRHRGVGRSLPSAATVRAASRCSPRFASLPRLFGGLSPDPRAR